MVLLLILRKKRSNPVQTRRTILASVVQRAPQILVLLLLQPKDSLVNGVYLPDVDTTYYCIISL
jgi:hypothetical protein